MSKVLCVGRKVNGKLVIEKVLREEVYRKVKKEVMYDRKTH